VHLEGGHVVPRLAIEVVSQSHPYKDYAVVQDKYAAARASESAARASENDARAARLRAEECARELKAELARRG
jgi:hypothetical protein